MNKFKFKKFNKDRNAFKICLDFFGNVFFVYCVVVALALILFSNVAVECEVFGASMQPTLNIHNEHDYVYVNKKDMKINYGDIIVVQTDTDNIIKRVVGLPGDRIAISKDEWVYKLNRNGELIEENYINISTNVTEPTSSRNGMDRIHSQMEGLREKFPSDFDEDGYYIVPENSVFVLGDNRSVSQDSSYYGAFKMSEVLGKVELIRYYDQSEFSFYWNYITQGKFIFTLCNIF